MRLFHDSRWRRTLAAMAIALSASTVTITSAPVAAADPGPSRIVSVQRVDNRTRIITVHSAAMDRDVPLWVMLPADNSAPRPTFYLLNGVGGGEDKTTWLQQTDLVDFMRDKNVNVVMPTLGRASYYTDWQRDDPKLGRNKWSTFLGVELPPLIDRELATNGTQSIAAISTSSTAVLNLAIEHPGLYRGVAAYSGCVQSADSVGQQLVKISVEDWGGGNVENMWGPIGGPDWVAHDPQVNVEKLRGTQIYMSSGNGIPGGVNDSYANPRIQDGRATMFEQLAIGGPIEMATAVCTDHMAKHLAAAGIPATVDIRKNGTHSWGYWQDDLHKSWPWIAGTLGL